MKEATVLAAILTIVAAAYWPKAFFILGSLYCFVWTAYWLDRHHPYVAAFIAGFVRGLFRVTLLLVTIMLLAQSADASTDCITRWSGSVKITTCSHSSSRGHVRFNTHCRSYKSGSVTKTYCR